jgi:quinoprotein glucose dehydrogenase
MLLLVSVLVPRSFGADRSMGRDWPVYLGDSGSSHYSALKQITPRNVHRLTVAWTYHAGDGRADNRSQIQCNPLIVDGVLYGTTAQLKLVALEAATGKELWRFDPFADAGGRGGGGVNRGVVCWSRGEERRILFAPGSFIFAVDAKTGKAIPSFGTNGRVDLHDGLGRDVRDLHVAASSPGVLFDDLLIQGTRVSEGPGPAAPGHIRAYDVKTGRIVWTFHTIPWPGEAGYETWPPEAWKYVGAANVWTGMAVDEKRGIVFCPTGSATFDFWGGHRLGQNLYANCLLALDARTGKRRWHFQLVHHDLWDRDLPAPPSLLTVRREGQKVDAVAQVTKSGHVFVFNRETGEPLFPIEERAVPPSDLQGESAWPTQPFPTKPRAFARQVFSADQLTDISPEAHRAALERWVKVRPHAPFTPPSKEGTIIFPGFDGGAEWGGAAVDPNGGLLYINGNEMPWILTMVEAHAKGSAPRSSGQRIYQQICAACHGVNRQGDSGRAFPTLVNIGQKLKQNDITQLLEQGRGVMPSFAFLNDGQRESVAKYLLGEETSADSRREPDESGDALGREPYSHTGYNRWLDTNGYPVVKPPWGTLNAINLNTGDFEWSVPLGEVPELKAKGIPPTGTENYGGPIATAGGLIFIGASKDEKFRAFDRRTGKVLWETQLPAGGYATPATYEVKGKQYVVIACGGGKMGTRSGDAYVAFALPSKP